MSPETAILTAVALPLIGSAGILLTGKAPNLREAVTLITGVVLTYIVVGVLLPVVMAG
ncbi:MAG: monovalent cation/H+ antiporter subunit D family protein, partial [Rhodospirillales bacterium]|nr:monovalent cation/H+ antiporter subunit D family protein [Rhodospirillales bacterium]